MRVLLDTHAVMWWLWGDDRLSQPASLAIQTATSVHVSSVSAIEITIKHRIGKLPRAGDLAAEFPQLMDAEGFVEQVVTWREAQLAGRMEHDHRDPFDRLLVAQGLLNDLTLVSNERMFDTFGVSRIW
jgi:PIN domain nuclease of toxin-antitoxin system